MKPNNFSARGVCIREETTGQVKAAASKAEVVYCAQTSVFAGSSMVRSEEVRQQYERRKDHRRNRVAGKAP
jgi:hypothetical protein